MYGQDTVRNIPNVAVNTLGGGSFYIKELTDSNLCIISFWATWCKPCVSELTEISEVYEDWQKETGVMLYAVSVDDARTYWNVYPLVYGKNWPFVVLLDVNQDFKRAMSVSQIPRTFIVYNGIVVYDHEGYISGDELEIYKKLKETVSKNTK
jgi:thiol-disulfide isomerase/thioredoxin